MINNMCDYELYDSILETSTHSVHFYCCLNMDHRGPHIGIVYEDDPRNSINYNAYDCKEARENFYLHWVMSKYDTL